MNTITTWLGENKIAAALAAFFVVATGALGWFAYTAWDAFGTAQAEYATKAEQIAKLSQRKPFPNQANLVKLQETISREEADLTSLTKNLQRYQIPPFAQVDKAKPQDMPQQFQDALRTEVTRIKSLAADSGVTLPPGFYLGLEDYENKLPLPEETLSLARQLSVLSWIAETIVGKKDLILAEFTRVPAGLEVKTEGARKGITSPDLSKPALPYQTSGIIRISFRSNQGSLRDIVNAISASPYFLLIDNIQIQNTSVEPPRRDAAPQSSQTSNDGSATVQKLPIIVGRELLNVSMKLHSLEFEQPQPKAR